ncbi:hypothetical protein K1719_025095 [Acacia pycnantha]|nr:hypothetical protein K1719_025095 [Acacia pycnantha]
MSGGAHPCVAAQDDSAATGEQPGYTMPDGSKVEIQVLSAADSNLNQILYLWTQKMRRDERYYSNLDVPVVGFDMEWSMVQEGDREDEINPRVTLLKLGTKYGCLLVKLDFK